MKRNLFLMIGAIALILSMAGCTEDDSGSPGVKPPVPITNVWMIGTHTGWLDIGHQDPIAMTANEEGIYTWTGDFAGGEYLRLNCDVNMPTDYTGNNWLTPPANSMIECKELGTPEETSYSRGANAERSWIIAYEGTFTITVNTKTSKVIFTRDSGPEISNEKAVWIVGAATVWTWNTTANKMTTADEITYTFTGTLKTGTEGLSFINNFDGPPNWSDTNCWFQSAAAGTAVANVTTAQEFDVVKGKGQAPMFVINFPGEYTITLNVNTLKATFVKAEVYVPPELTNEFDVWLIGASTVPQWSPGHADLKMTKGANGVYTWTGNLTAAGEGVSFATNHDTPFTVGDWDNAKKNPWFDPADATEVVSGTAMNIQQIVGQGGAFSFLTAGAGIYSITLDTKNFKVTFTKEGDIPQEPPSVWVVGASTVWTWSTTDNKMTTTDDITYTFTGTLKTGTEGLSFIHNFYGPPNWSGIDCWFKATAAGTSVANVTTAQVFDVVEGAGQAPMFVINFPGVYTITLNVQTKKVTFVKAEVYVPPGLTNDFDVWLIGAATVPEWSPGHADLKMTKGTNGVYTWTGNLTAAGQGVSFATNHDTPFNAGDWDNAKKNPWFEPADETVVVSGTAMNVKQVVGQGGAFSFLTAGAGIYSISLDTKNLKVTFTRTGDIPTEPLRIWMVGSSMGHDPWGLQDFEMTAVQAEEGVFTWTGDLYSTQHGQGVAFATNIGGPPSWNGADKWIVSALNPEADRTFTNDVNTPQEFSVKKHTTNENFFLTFTPGNYTVTLNTNTNKVTFTLNSVYNPAIEKVWLIGVDGKWGLGEAIALNDEGDGTFTYSGILEGEIKINGAATPDWNKSTWIHPVLKSNIEVKCFEKNEAVELGYGIGDNDKNGGWIVFYEEEYDIIVDTVKKIVSFTRTSGDQTIVDVPFILGNVENIWLAGGGNSYHIHVDGTDGMDAYKFTKEANGTFTLSVNLADQHDGKSWFRFYAETDVTYSYFCPVVNDSPVTVGVPASIIDAISQAGNFSWEASAGSVIITIDLTAGTFTIAAQ